MRDSPPVSSGAPESETHLPPVASGAVGLMPFSTTSQEVALPSFAKLTTIFSRSAGFVVAANAANGTHMTIMNAAVSRASRRVLKFVFCMLNLLFFKYLSKAFCRQMPQAHLLTGAVDTDIYPTPPLGMRAVNQRLLFPLKKEIQKP